MIRVLIVDDSEIYRKLISYALNDEPGIEVVGTAENPYVARDLINLLKPDVITLDLRMPRMDGLTFLGKIMKSHPYPVIIVSCYTPKESSYALKALRMGALDTISKPGLEYNLKQFSERLVQTVRGAAGARVQPGKINKTVSPAPVSVGNAGQKIIAIGSSTGGTKALEFLLNNLPEGLPGIVIVQHLPESFTKSFADRLNKHSPLSIREAADNEPITPGCVYIAKGDKHLTVQRRGEKNYVRVSDGQRINFHRPSVDVLFDSVVEEFGPQATGIILTGMGSDGAEGLLKMRNNGAFTIGQDELSSVVYGMPKAAFEIGAVCEQLPLNDIPDRILSAVSKHSKLIAK
ncbi:protein-glutamate methylesterase/protein-glutamine glutaminase [Rhodohalobacter sp. 8-1]|uniref:protein-glutamate methylesterase/protein-glutamine glutaminase n=1 Tax=Rhodohalobacter sp. 8-1 TaxID=3131972 RepID=UPI0030EEDF89